MVAVQSPRPLNGAGAEHQRAAAVFVQRQRMRRRPRAEGRTIVHQDGRAIDGRSRQADQAGGTKVVVDILVPLVAQRSERQRGLTPRREIRDAGVAPEPHLAVFRRHLDGRGCPVVDREQGSGQRVFRSSAVLGRAVARIAPGTGPHVGQRIGIVGEVVRFLVADQRAVRRSRSVDAVLPTDFPEHLVAAEEREVATRIPRRFDIGALHVRPILIMTYRQEQLVVGNQVAAPVAVDAGEIADVVAVRLEPAHHWILGVEQPVLTAIHASRVERTVVTDLVRPAIGASTGTGTTPGVQAIAAVGVVGLPGRIRGLEQDVGRTRIVAHDEDDVACPAGIGAILADRFREVDSGDGIRRHRPRGGFGPVSAIHQTRRVSEAVRLSLWQRCRGLYGRDFAGAIPAVITHAINIEPVVC